MKGLQIAISNVDVLQSLYFIFILANSTDPGEMQRTLTFHLVLHRLPKYLLMGFQYI